MRGQSVRARGSSLVREEESERRVLRAERCREMGIEEMAPGGGEGTRERGSSDSGRLGFDREWALGQIGLRTPFFLSLFSLTSRKKTEKDKEGKERKEAKSGQEFGHGDYFPGLAKK